MHEEPRTGSLLWRCVLWPPSSQLMGATMWSALQWPRHSSKASISTSLQGNRIKTLLVNWSRHFLDLYITCCKRGPREMLVIFWASMVPVLLDQYVCVILDLQYTAKDGSVQDYEPDTLTSYHGGLPKSLRNWDIRGTY